MKNPNCEGAHCDRPGGVVRLVPICPGNPDAGNMILCQECFNYEMQARREFNELRNTGVPAADIPIWQSLNIYNTPISRRQKILNDALDPSGITCLHALDQVLVTELCEIIRRLESALISTGQFDTPSIQQLM